MKTTPGTVYVVDDDPAVRDGIGSLLRSIGLHTRAFGSAGDFLKHPLPRNAPACLILDVRLPGANGLDLQSELASQEPPVPIIFLTGHGTIPMSVRAMKNGAAGFLTKPFDADALVEAIRQALRENQAAWAQRDQLHELRARYERLTPREREVLALVVEGRLNKQIAAALGTAEQTVKVHRGRVMRKLEVGSVAELVRAVARIVPRQ